MHRKGFVRRFKALEILTEDQIEEIHKATLDVLWETGIRIEHEGALKVLEKNGCRVNYQGNRVYFPPRLVEECLRNCPSQFQLTARDPKDSLWVGDNRTYFGAAPGMTTVDLKTMEPRVPTRKEMYDAVTVLDALETVDYIMQYTPYFGFEGVPPAMAMIETLAAKLRNSTKFTAEGYSNDCEIFTIKMFQAVGADMFLSCLPSPPLTYHRGSIEACLRAVEAGFAIKVGGGGMYGGTAPATIAGATVTNNAELIAPIVLFQLIRPGTRIIVYNFNYPQNMRNGAPAFGAIECSLHTAIFNQTWRRYGLPTWDDSGEFSSSKGIDFQLGYEKSMNTLLPALCGGNGISVHGAIFGELTYHPFQAILDDDIVGMIGRFLQGVEVNTETLATDVIKAVGPIPGHFLNREHTQRWWKAEQFLPKAADRLTYPEWMEKGKKSALDYAGERMREILETHRVSLPLTPSQEEDIQRIIREAKEFYTQKGLI
jgi:trimethylamine--corrinoid protein Co-methyltransferase